MGILGKLGRRDAVRHEVQRSRQALVRIAYGWCHDAQLAEDLAQEAVEKALRNAAQVQEPERLKGWLYRILANCLRDHYRARREHDDLHEHADALADAGPTPEESQVRTQVTARVRRAVAELPPGQRQTVTLVDLEGCSYAEVSEALQIPIGTVMSRLCRARQALRARLLGMAPDERETKLRSVK